ncbi:hypothetical protein [Butyrivibrio sp. JL13D10]
MNCIGGLESIDEGEID